MTSGEVHFSGCKALLALVLAAGALASFQAQAQAVYRIVGPDGKLTFSDRPPPVPASNSSISEASPQSGTGNAAPSGLPFELRQVALKYPVVLYTGGDCAPCGAGRSLLSSRGIPFSEKTVTTAADAEALQRLSGEASLPFLTIGSQQLKGFSDAEWTQFLNAAGYPKSSTLLSGYRMPAPVPLVAAAALPSAPPAGQGNASKAAAKSPAARPVQAPPSTGNPAGIRF